MRVHLNVTLVYSNGWDLFVLTDSSISSLVYSMRSENIVSVMCNGQWIMKDGKILNVNEVFCSNLFLFVVYVLKIGRERGINNICKFTFDHPSFVHILRKV